MKKRETDWDEPDTTTPQPLLPGGPAQVAKNSSAMASYLQRIYSEGVTEQIRAMCEERRPVSKLITDIPAIREEGDNLIIPVIVEKMVLVKKMVLLEEIVLCPQTVDSDGNVESC